jgi:hypothetical protein
MAVAETLIRHASDWIDWIDRTGFAAPDHQPRVDSPLVVTLDQAPRDLQLYPKRGQTVLWRLRPEDLIALTRGPASASDLARPTEAPYPVEGWVSDPDGRFSPRRFSLNGGNAAGHALALYRSPKGTRLGSAGGLRGHIRIDGGPAVPWALVQVEITLPTAQKLPFIAQADANGDFLLPLDRLPALTKDALSATYPATLDIRADLTASPESPSDPDGFAPATLRDPTDGSQVITATLSVAPGGIASIMSRGLDHIALVPPP